MLVARPGGRRESTAAQAFGFSAVESAAADHFAIEEQDRHFVPESPPEPGILVDVHYPHRCVRFAEERVQLLEHDMAKMAVNAADERVSGHRGRGPTAHGRRDEAPVGRADGCTEPAISSTVFGGTSPTAVTW